MKLIKISSLVLLGGAMLLNSSCKKTFFTNANNNPNAPKTVTPSVMLSTVEGSLAYVQGGDMSRFSSMFMQQTFGASRQCAAYYQYTITNQDVDQVWSNMYTSVLMNDDSLMRPSDNKGYSLYSGVARVLMAYSLQLTVDFWGSAPYSTAFMGPANLHPTYDGDKGLYDKIITLCDDAITKLGDTTTQVFAPGSEDVIYGGSTDQWIKFAHAVKARIYMHQSKGNVAMANKALAEIALSFTSNADNATYPFTGNTETSAHPWYQFNEQRDDISFISGSMIASMTDNNDPRVTMLVDSADAMTNGDGLTAFYGGITGNVEFITYEELQFMKAEALLNTGASIASVQTAYQEGIKASMTKLKVSATDMAAYITSKGTITTANALSKIAWEEYVALYLNPEAWTLYRRTGYPNITPVKAAGVPRRMLYPQTELSYNKVNVPASTMYSPKVFWDN